ncbi:hypothetical protein SE16_03950 [Ardenticatena maritima]|uniref:Secreted protein n=1 Tax=Ardenticatena maritima TaxID=872965 RepID=A0A0P6YIX1_9CHLR|nr:hypothetical protein SE16_03950 [Ardenticatena maritima]
MGMRHIHYYITTVFALILVFHSNVAMAQGPVYTPYQFETFNGGACTAGWAVERIQSVDCTGDTVLVDSDITKRENTRLWRNDLFPAPGQPWALEVRYRYPSLRGYGTDALVVFEAAYNGEQSCVFSLPMRD